jgi:hypothetical protein
MASPKLEWRPIDTAPKHEGRGLLVSDGDQVEPAEWVDWGPQGRGFWTFMRVEVEFTPTHWMPFPPAPYQNKDDAA